MNFLNAGHARVSRDGIGAIVEDRHRPAAARESARV